MSKQYEIKTIEDMMKVPADKIDEFAVDLVEFLKMAADAQAISKILGVKVPMSFTWIDDGKHDRQITFKVEGGSK